MLNDKSWNKSIKPMFTRELIENNEFTEESTLITHYSFEYEAKFNIPNALLNASYVGFPVLNDGDYLEFKYMFESSFLFAEIDKSEDFNYWLDTVLKKNVSTFFDNLHLFKKAWILLDDFDHKIALILHIDNSISYFKYSFVD